LDTVVPSPSWPTPWAPQQGHRAAGFGYGLSILQCEASLTRVFDHPLRGREFFKEVLRDQLDLGRPDQVALLIERRITAATAGRFRTRVITAGVRPSFHVDCTHSRLKKYFTKEHVLHTEATFNDTYDVGVRRGLGNLRYPRQLGDPITGRLLALEQVAHDRGLAPAQLAELPTRAPPGQWATRGFLQYSTRRHRRANPVISRSLWWATMALAIWPVGQ
jgi:hypothetical protein